MKNKTLYIPPDVHDKIMRLAAKHEVSKAAILDYAIKQFPTTIAPFRQKELRLKYPTRPQLSYLRWLEASETFYLSLCGINRTGRGIFSGTSVCGVSNAQADTLLAKFVAAGIADKAGNILADLELPLADTNQEIYYQLFDAPRLIKRPRKTKKARNAHDE